MSYPEHETVESAAAMDARTRADRIAVQMTANFTPAQKARAELALHIGIWEAERIENLIRAIVAEGGPK